MSSNIIPAVTLAVDALCEIPELIHCIFEHLEADIDLEQLEVLLARISTLSKTHGVPIVARSRLWYNLRGLQRAINTMPPGVFQAGSPREWKSLVETKNNLPLAHWTRPLFYLSHVRNLVLNQGPDLFQHFPAVDLLRIMAPVHHRQVLLAPNLHTLSWYPPTPHEAATWAPYLRLFLSPSLVQFHMLVDHTSDIWSIFDQIPGDFWAGLQIVSLESRQFESNLWSSTGVSTYVSRLQDARYVSTDLLGDDNECILALGRLRRLETARITWLRAENIPSSAHADLFTCLRCLHLQVANPASPAGLLPLIRSDCLDTIQVKCFCGKADEYRLLFNALAALEYPLQVQRLCINNFDPASYYVHTGSQSPEAHLTYLYTLLNEVHAARDDFELSTECLRSLAPFVNLTELSLVVPLGFTNLDDKLLNEVTRYWPRLELLSLIPHVPSLGHRHIPIHLTLKSLFTIAANCRNLHSLGLLINASDCPIEELLAQALAIPASPQLFHIDVFDSPVRKPRTVARFLSCIFPRLRAISAYVYPLELLDTLGATGRHYDYTWRQAQDLLKDMAEIWEHVPGRSCRGIDVKVTDEDLRWLGESGGKTDC